MKNEKELQFRPFENDAQIFQLGQLCIENHADQLRMYGTHNFDFSQKGLQDLRVFQKMCTASLKVLEQALEQGTLPKELVTTLAPSTTQPNPFN